MNEHGPETLIDAVRYFGDRAMCESYMVGIKWPDGRIVCPRCESDNVGTIATRSMFKCRACKKQFSSKVGTIFEDSPLPLSSWFVAVWLNAKNGVSSCELGRAIGVTQKSAWFMLHRIRLAMRTGTFRKLHGTVESDETFVGGRAANMADQQQPTGGAPFDALARRLVKVPAEIVVASEKRYEQKKKQRKRKRKS